MIAIYILSFQGPAGGLTFPLRGVSLHWFDALFSQAADRRFRRRVRPFAAAGADRHSLTVLISVTAGFAFRRRFPGSTASSTSRSPA